MCGGRIIGFGTSRPSTFFSTDRSMSYPNTGTERPGALMRSRTTTWTACFTTLRPRRGSGEHPDRLRFYLNDLLQKRTSGSAGNRLTSKDRLTEIFWGNALRRLRGLVFPM